MPSLAPLPNSLADGQLPVTATAVLLLTVLLALAWQARAQRRMWALFAALAVVAVAMRAVAAWGPADLAEARRWDVLYALQPDNRPLFYGIPTLVELLARLGLPPAGLYRGFGFASGGLAVVATAGLALAMELPLLWAGAAGLLVALWPAHIHYSVSGGFTVLAGAAVAATLAVARADRLLGAWKPLAAASLATFAIYARPEARVVLLGLGVLALRPAWSWRQRGQLVAMLMVLLSGYASVLLSPGERFVESSPGDLAYWLLGEPRVAPVWWCAAGLAGLVVGRGERHARAGLAVVLVALLGGYMLTTEPNAGFGLWRYYMTLLPLVAVGAALLLPRWPLLERQGAVVLAGIAATLLPYSALWLQTSDLHAEFATLQQGAQAALAQTDLLLLPDQAGDAHTGVDHFATALLALNLATGLRFNAQPDAQPGHQQRGRLGEVAVASLEAWLADPQRPRPKRVVAWVGLPVSPEREAHLRALGPWRPLGRFAGDVMVQLPESNVRCPPAVGLGVTLQPCHLQVGWQVLEP